MSLDKAKPGFNFMKLLHNKIFKVFFSKRNRRWQWGRRVWRLIWRKYANIRFWRVFN